MQIKIKLRKICAIFRAGAHDVMIKNGCSLRTR